MPCALQVGIAPVRHIERRVLNSPILGLHRDLTWRSDLGALDPVAAWPRDDMHAPDLSMCLSRTRNLHWRHSRGIHVHSLN